MGIFDPEQVRAQMEAEWEEQEFVDAEVSFDDIPAELSPAERVINAAGLLGTSNTFPRRIPRHRFWDKKTHRANEVPHTKQTAETGDEEPVIGLNETEPVLDTSHWTAKDRRVVATEVDLREEFDITGEAPVSRKEAAQAILNLIPVTPLQDATTFNQG